LPSPHVSTQDLQRDFLDDLTLETGGKYVRVQDSKELRANFVKIFSEIRTRYLLTYVPSGVPTGGWHPIDVKVTGQRADVRARRGYLRARQ
jgi:hypothetical protein